MAGSGTGPGGGAGRAVRTQPGTLEEEHEEVEAAGLQSVCSAVSGSQLRGKYPEQRAFLASVAGFGGNHVLRLSVRSGVRGDRGADHQSAVLYRQRRSLVLLRCQRWDCGCGRPGGEKAVAGYFFRNAERLRHDGFCHAADQPSDQSAAGKRQHRQSVGGRGDRIHEGTGNPHHSVGAHRTAVCGAAG